MSIDPNPYAPPQIDAPPTLPAGAKPSAPCPACGVAFAKPVGFTWWGGVLGPKLFSHAKCIQCGTAFNSKTGQSNNTKIAMYLAVSSFIGLALGLLMFLA
jgi:hypothetical protein